MSILLKNRVWFSVYKGLADFLDRIFGEKCPAQFAFGFERTEPRPDWFKIGAVQI